MTTAIQMLEIAGTIEKAEEMARGYVKEKGNNFLQDLELTISLQGRFDEAEEILNKILEENPNDVRARFNKGFFIARKGKLLEGFKYMNEGRAIEVWGNKHIGTPKPIWDGSGDGQYVLVNMEAGIGDQIIFARFIKNIERRGAKPIVCCSSELKTIFSRISSCSAVVDAEVALNIYHDFWVPSMGIPIVLGIEYQDLDGWSYLTAESRFTNKFKEIIKGDKIKVGIRWAGSPTFEHEQFRLFPKEFMFNVVNKDYLDVYSLQDDIDKIPNHITNLSGFLQSWEDTAGAIDNMDLVISSCTAVAHLAAAMGKPTWVVVPILPYWAWALPGDKSPWHNSARIFRQERFDHWDEPFS